MDFRVEVMLGGQVTPIRAFLGPPCLNPETPNCWTCGFGWDGEHAVTRAAFGATALQSMTLAIDLLEVSLVSQFPGATFLQDGAPFLLPPADAAD